MASEYFAEIQQEYERMSESALELEETYASIAEALDKLSDKAMDTEEKVALLAKTKRKEAAAIEMVAAFAAMAATSSRPVMSETRHERDRVAVFMTGPPERTGNLAQADHRYVPRSCRVAPVGGSFTLRFANTPPLVSSMSRHPLSSVL